MRCTRWSHRRNRRRHRRCVRQAGTKDALTIDGVGNLLTQLARCCQPLPGDAVMGFITRGRGVSVHRADCASLARLRVRDPSRVIEVEWGNRREQAYEVDVLVKGYDRKWLHKDITNVIASANAHLLAVNTRVDPVSGSRDHEFRAARDGLWPTVQPARQARSRAECDRGAAVGVKRGTRGE